MSESNMSKINIDSGLHHKRSEMMMHKPQFYSNVKTPEFNLISTSTFNITEK